MRPHQDYSWGFSAWYFGCRQFELKTFKSLYNFTYRHLGSPCGLTTLPWIQPSWTICWVSTAQPLPADTPGLQHPRTKQQLIKPVGGHKTGGHTYLSLPLILTLLPLLIQLISWRILTPTTPWCCLMGVTGSSSEEQCQIHLWGNSWTNLRSLFLHFPTPGPVISQLLGNSRYKNSGYTFCYILSYMNLEKYSR